jgi:uncharacterized membrane-anchored protein
MGDILTKTPEKGGIGFGTIGSSLILLLVLLAFIFYTVKKQKNFIHD